MLVLDNRDTKTRDSPTSVQRTLLTLAVRQDRGETQVTLSLSAICTSVGVAVDSLFRQSTANDLSGSLFLPLSFVVN